MSLDDNIKAGAKDLEGRLQSAAGSVSGDTSMQAAGQAKQVQAKVMHAASDLKDKARNLLSNLHKPTR